MLAPVTNATAPSPALQLREGLEALRATQAAAQSAVRAVGTTETARAVAQSADVDRLRAQQEERGRWSDGLTPEQRQMLERLRSRDREVREHEAAHERVGGAYAGDAIFDMQVGPDGKQYAIAGEVPIDVSPVEGDPEATILKMQVVKAAALAPAEPSSQDRRIAALADARRMQAQAELLLQRTEPSPAAEFLTALDEAARDPLRTQRYSVSA